MQDNTDEEFYVFCHVPLRLVGTLSQSLISRFDKLMSNLFNLKNMYLNYINYLDFSQSQH